jgi:hypothetical protein
MPVKKTNTTLCLNSVSLDNVIFNDTDTFVDSVGLVDVTKIDIGLCLSSVDFPSVILNNSGTLVSVSDGWCHPPDSGITLQCQLLCSTLIFDILCVVDGVSD